MASLTEAVQDKVRSLTGTAYTWEGDWHALFDSYSIPARQFNERLKLYMIATHTEPGLYLDMTASARLNYYLQDPSKIV